MTFKRAEDLVNLRNCTVIEGNLVITLNIMDTDIYMEEQRPRPENLNLTFPEVGFPLTILCVRV